MVRSRGVSRRGSTSGTRGRASQFAPQNIILLASAAPPSPPSAHGRELPNNSFQTTRFKFHSQLNKPVLTASITIILVEEEDKPNSSVHTTTSQSQDDSVLQGDVVGTVFNWDNVQEEGNIPEAPQPPVETTPRNLQMDDLEHPSISNLNLEVHLGGGDLGDGDNAVDMWMGSPSQVATDAPDALKNA